MLIFTRRNTFRELLIPINKLPGFFIVNDRLNYKSKTMATIQASELIINDDGSIFHLHLLPEDLADHVILVGDPGRVETIAAHFDNIELKKSNREFYTITGTYNKHRISVISTGIGPDNIDIVINELDALANIDLKTKEVKTGGRVLNIVRIGHIGFRAGRHPGGLIRHFRKKHRLRWSAALLRRQRRHLRQTFRGCFYPPLPMDTQCSPPVRGKRFCRTGRPLTYRR